MDRPAPPTRPVAAQSSAPLGQVIAVTIGNGLEFYDFLTFALFAVYIGKAFFPSTDPAISLLASLATFGAGFLTRPIGGIVLGSLGDRIGRKPAMLLSFSLIGLGMLGIALTPPYAQIGLAAPLLAIVFRLVQGFALGGEVGPSTAFMLEAAPARRRGFYASLQYVSQNAAVLAAALMGLALSTALSKAQLESFGWRIAFLAGVSIVPFGLWLRRRLPETLLTRTAGTASAREPLRPHARVMALAFLLLVSSTIATYVTDYMTTYALDTLHMAAQVAFGVTVLTSLIGIFASVGAGALSDRWGRRPLMIWPVLAAALTTAPVFWLINLYPTVAVFYGGMALLTILTNVGSTPVIIALTESLPARIRSGGVATVYAFAISIFGGSTQFVIRWLIKVTHDPTAPGWYMTGALTLGFVAALAVRESAPAKAQVAQAGAALVADGAPAPG